MRRLFLTEKRRIEISHHDVGAAMESEIGAETIEHYPQLSEKALYRLPLHAHPSRTLGLAMSQYKSPIGENQQRVKHHVQQAHAHHQHTW